jgi:hypothetical protein
MWAVLHSYLQAWFVPFVYYAKTPEGEGAVELHLTNEHTALIQPFLGSGFSTGGLYLQLDDRLPPMLGRVLDVHQSITAVSPGDVVVYDVGAYQELEWEHGKLYFIHEQAIAAVLHGYDEVYSV